MFSAPRDLREIPDGAREPRSSKIDGVTDVVERHLRALDGALRGPRRVKADLLEEAAGHLEDAVDAHLQRGLGPDEARARAVSEFGAVEDVAPGFQTTLAVSASRRAAWLLLAGTAPQALLWDSGLDLGTRVAHAEDPRTPVFAVLDTVIEVGGMIAIAGMLVALLATGIGNRWLRAGRATARATGIFVLGSAFVMPCVGFTMITLSAGVDLTMYAVAAVLLGGPMLLAGAAARRCLAAA